MLARFPFCFRFRDFVSVSGFRIPDFIAEYKINRANIARMTETLGLN